MYAVAHELTTEFGCGKCRQVTVTHWLAHVNFDISVHDWMLMKVPARQFSPGLVITFKNCLQESTDTLHLPD